MRQHDFVLLFLALISEVIGTISGFGSSTFFVPIAAFFENLQFVLVLTAILHCFSNAFRIFLFSKHLNLKVVAQYVLPFTLLTIVGATLSSTLPIEKLKFTLGAFLVFLSATIFFSKKVSWRISDRAASGLIWLSGFATGLVGTGGAIRGLALSSINLEKNIFIATSASIDFWGDLFRASIYLYSGFMDWSHWFYVPLLGLAAYAGTKLGQFLVDKIPQKSFDVIVHIFVAASGFALMFGSK